jgi:hypothetical protein
MRSRYRPAVPRAIDPRSGFDIPHSDLVRQYDGELIARRYVDKQNPQDRIQIHAEQIALPDPRPEPPEIGVAGNILIEAVSALPIIGANGVALLTEGGKITL